MKSETLNKIDAALRRLEENTYGNCYECGDEISLVDTFIHLRGEVRTRGHS